MAQTSPIDSSFCPVPRSGSKTKRMGKYGNDAKEKTWKRNSELKYACVSHSLRT
ncbi:hypothetical protein COLO4_05442 [Corchorus olitorius]|uniref:Uncharacterized protein n=1 Tax=Corchorus olitorius TaxID=93759 RepID=A0A1R3KQV4_9ROSI|nr:hypothetical protein COLO4_05442 [Corchorus olitorius]